MKASIAHGVRPSVLILGKDSRKPWGKWDIVLARAYQRFLNELCGQCGLPKYICHNDDNRIQFRLGNDECESTALAEREQASLTEKDVKTFGRRLYGEPYLTDDAKEEGLELSDFRRPYLIDRMKRMGLIPETSESTPPEPVP